MPFLSNTCLDAALAILDTLGTRLDITHTEATTYAQATSTWTVGNKTSLVIGAPANRTPTGRQVTIATFSDGNFTATATGVGDDAQFWAISDPVGAVLLATGTLAAAQMQTSGNTFSLAAFNIGIPGAV